MGVANSCCRRKRKLESPLHRARKKYSLRIEHGHVESNLVTDCINCISINSNRLTGRDWSLIHGWGVGLATELLQGLVRYVCSVWGHEKRMCILLLHVD